LGEIEGARTLDELRLNLLDGRPENDGLMTDQGISYLGAVAPLPAGLWVARWKEDGVSAGAAPPSMAALAR
jgi:hypothetical protein